MYKRKFTSEKIETLAPNEVFVFGSNLAGQHHGGAARVAYQKFGAEWGQGIGHYGQTYAIPTMQGGVDTIKPYVDEFISFAKENTHLIFLVTRIGCGIAGFKDSEIGPLFKDAIDVDNIYLPKEFVECINNSSVDSFNLQRFLDAQELDYEQALKEIKNGQKRTHWIWYISPQLASLGHSYNAKYYGISGYDEAAAYLAHPVLNEHLRTITKALLWHKRWEIEDIMGKIDAMKLCSCMTLFDAVSPNDIFGTVLIEFYDGVRDENTLQILRNTK